MAAKWIIEADLVFLEPAAGFACLDPNAIREYPGPGNVGVLTYPAPFCRHSLDWMRALSHLVARDRDFSLFLIEVDENDRELGRTRIFPVLDTETLAFLRQINAAEADDLHSQSRRIGEILHRLRQQATLSFLDDITGPGDPASSH